VGQAVNRYINSEKLDAVDCGNQIVNVQINYLTPQLS
jgi:hypothetical protein